MTSGEWNKQNRGKCRKAFKKWYWKNPEHARKLGRECYYRNQENRLSKLRTRFKLDLEFRKRCYKSSQRWVARNPSAKIAQALRSRIWQVFKRQVVSISTRELIGCSWDFLASYLAARFKKGMTWKNHGRVWHIDHILPCAKFNLTNPFQQRICFHYTNLQPLFKQENLKKGSR